MTEKTIVLTGATSGIGAASAHRFATTTDRLILHGPQSVREVSPLLRELSAGTRAEVHYLRADYDDLNDVARLAEGVRGVTNHVDVLVNNAGRPGAEHREVSRHGYEATWQTNYLAAVLLTEHLEPLLARVGGRVVHVASATHLSVTLDLDDIGLHHGYSPVGAYARSKLAMVGHARWQAERWGATGPSIVSISPGVISTGLLHAMFSVRGHEPGHGAGHVVDAATAPLPFSGAYLDEGLLTRPNPLVEDPAFRSRLHAVTAELLAPWRP